VPRSAPVLAARIGVDERPGRRRDQLVVEEPLELRCGEVVVATTMRTPGHDFELAVGFCHAEGYLGDGSVRDVRYCATGSAVDTAFNVVTVQPGGRGGRAPAARVGNVSSSCGWCGSDSVDELVERLERVEAVPPPSPEVLSGLDAAVRERQELFARTGASHAAAWFDPADGSVRQLREDIGRHNAVDKVVGRLRLDGHLPAVGTGLWVSGRASFEIVQKAWAAGVGLLVAVSAPSSLAVATAAAAGLTLVGFARDGAATLYVDGTTP